MAGQLTRRPRIRRGGFTLIELLVVISIIALLFSILLPSLNRVRKQAAGVVCMSQVRQAGTGMVVYMNMSDCFLPHQIRMREFDHSLPSKSDRVPPVASR